MAKVQKFNQLPETIQNQIEQFFLNPELDDETHTSKNQKKFLFDVLLELKEQDFTATQPACIIISSLHSIINKIEDLQQEPVIKEN